MFAEHAASVFRADLKMEAVFLSTKLRYLHIRVYHTLS